MLSKPLAELLRPQSLKDFIGQDHIAGKDGPISKAIKNKNIFSMIFWGPPGSGKTTLARIISKEIGAEFVEITPATSGVKDIKLAVEKAKSEFFGTKKKTILFVDEIHRFNKAQQDYLLPHVENGTITLIGATTENPSFEVVSPLLSRTRVYVLQPIPVKDMHKIVKNGIKFLINQNISLNLTKEAEKFLVQISNGDARIVLNALDALVISGMKDAGVNDVQKILQENPNRYDKKGDEHYNTISAYIKSMRAGKINAALYYLARMVNAGEDSLFIARRMVIFASEDIGLANTSATIVANEIFKACETIGYPECQINLAHGTVFLCLSKKTRKSYDAYFKALDDVKKYGNLEIPLHIRNAPTKLMKDLGYGKNYEMYPSEKTSYLPKILEERNYY